ncbi:hypothetical protein GGI17_006622, partial [Coemansia sp. S146]
MESEQLEYLLSTIENVLENQREFYARLEAAERAIQAQSDRSTGPSRSTTEVERETENYESSDDDIHLDSESDDGDDDDVVEPLDKQPAWKKLHRQYMHRSSGLAPPPTTDSGRATNNTFNQASAMAACGAELLRIALSSPQVDRRLTRQASDVFAALKDTLAGLRDRHTDCLSQVAGENADVIRRTQDMDVESEPRLVSAGPLEDATQAGRPSTRWWGRRVGGSDVNVLSHPYLRSNSRPASSQQHQHQQLRNGSTPGTERGDDSTADSSLTVHIPSVVGSREPSIGVEDASPDTLLATVSGSDTMAEESADSVGDASVADSSMIAVVELDPALDNQPMTVLSRQDVIGDALLRQ